MEEAVPDSLRRLWAHGTPSPHPHVTRVGAYDGRIGITIDSDLQRKYCNGYFNILMQ